MAVIGKGVMEVRRKRAKARADLLLPNLLTLLNLLFGVIALLSLYHGKLRQAALSILVAALFDAIDGRVARMTRSTTAFGRELDSLADLISFGVAPGFLFYTWALKGQRIGWVAVFLYVACGALRLARFNVRGSLREFEGLPIPSAGCFLASFFLLWQRFGLGTPHPYVVAALAFLLGFLMVSSLRYPSLKGELLGRGYFRGAVAFVLLLVFFLFERDLLLFALFGTYVAYGPLKQLRVVARRQRRYEGQRP